MFLSKKLNEFLHEKSLEENPGSAAESQVRPPNMHAFWRHVRPPKAWVREVKVRPPNLMFGRRTLHGYGGTFGPRTWPGQPHIKGSLWSTRASFFSPIVGQGESPLLLPQSWVFSLGLSWFSRVLTSILKICEQRASFGCLEVQGAQSLHLHARIVFPLISSRGKLGSTLIMCSR